ncbi:MAG: hypothetical protein II515_07330 [Desulfovibrio sp.]|nr:hypothetical protein [Desulfovibrio sp.]
MKSWPLLCLCLVLALVLPGECAGDPLSELDSLILDNQRKLNREGDQGRRSGQTQERGRNSADSQERPPQPERRELRRPARPQRPQKPLVAPGSPSRDPAFQIPPARRQETRMGPSGGVREYGPYYARFAIWIPPGWTAVPVEGGVRSASPDGRTAVGVVIRSAGGRSAEELARRAARQSGLDQVARQGRNTWVASGVKQNVLVRVLVHESAGRAVFVTFAGRDLATVRKMVQSLKDVRREF